MPIATPCYYLPKQIMTEEYAAFSVESKLLFSMVFTNARHIKAIYETAELIKKINEHDLIVMHNHLLQSEQEDNANV